MRGCAGGEPALVLRRTLPPVAAQRLSWISSGLPWFFVPDDCVEDGEEFSGDGDEGEFLGFSCCDEALVEGLRHVDSEGNL